MGSCREILTFQIGNYANYIGSHWWNIQQSSFQYSPSEKSEICHDVLFREGKTLRGDVTFTPRLIIVDSKENFNYLPTLRESEETELLTENQLEEFNQTKPKIHEFQKDLDKIDSGERIDLNTKDYTFSDSVSYWSDFSRVKYLPKSVLQVNGSSMQVFLTHNDIFKTIEEDFVENLRSFIEECDNVQGFQMIVDCFDGFGGLGSSILLHLQDEYSNKTRLTFPTIPSSYTNSTPKQDGVHTVNSFLSYQKLAENSAITIPLSCASSAWRSLGPEVTFPHIKYSGNTWYESSAILASFLDTYTLRYRLNDDRSFMHDIVNGLSGHGRKICSAGITLPFPMQPSSYLLDTLEALDETKPFFQSLTPGCSSSTEPWIQSVSVRGIANSRLRNPTVQKSENQTHTCSNVKELLQLYLSFSSSAITDVGAVTIPLNTTVPFPQFFSPHVSSLGSVDDSSTRVAGLKVASVPMMSAISNSKEIGSMLESLNDVVSRINIKRFHEFCEGIDGDEYREINEDFLKLKLAYAPDGNQSDSD